MVTNSDIVQYVKVKIIFDYHQFLPVQITSFANIEATMLVNPTPEPTSNTVLSVKSP